MTVTAQTTSSLGDMHDPTSPAYKRARRKHWKSTRNRPDHVDADWTPFRAAEKKYKAHFPPPDLFDVLDLALADPARAVETARGGWKGRVDAVECREVPLHNSDGEGGRKAYIFPGTPGAPFVVVVCELYVFMLFHSVVEYIRPSAPTFLRAALRTETTGAMGTPRSCSQSERDEPRHPLSPPTRRLVESVPSRAQGRVRGRGHSTAWVSTSIVSNKTGCPLDG